MRTVKLTQPDAWRQAPPADALRPWLSARGSLTARIAARFDGFNLLRLSQKRAQPYADERRALGLKRGQRAVVREVILRSGGTPLVFAHSVATPVSLRGAWRGLSRLGARPLAEMLFRDPLVTRMPIEYRKLDRRHALFRKAIATADRPARFLWARRSVFLKRRTPLLVTEVFLPAIDSDSQRRRLGGT